MKFVLVRHSKTKFDPSISIPLWYLTDEGKEKAIELFNHKDFPKIDLVYSSLQTKAVETALILAKSQTIPLKTDVDLTEVSSFTKEVFTNGYEEMVDSYYTGRVERLSGGETITEALERFEKTLDKISEIEKDKENIAVVTHGNILAFLTSKYDTTRTARELHDFIQMPDYSMIDWNTKKFIKYWEGKK